MQALIISRLLTTVFIVTLIYDQGSHLVTFSNSQVGKVMPYKGNVFCKYFENIRKYFMYKITSLFLN